MALRGVCMMCRHLVIVCFVMLGCLAMVTRRVFMMLGRLMMVLCSLFGHLPLLSMCDPN
jgi:hypothetical protein